MRSADDDTLYSPEHHSDPVHGGPKGPQDSDGRDMERAARALLFGAPVPSRTSGAADAAATLSNRPHNELIRGTVVDRYVILDKLGAGGMGIVYAAYDPELDRKVALKLVLPSRSSSSGGRTRLMREAQALARLTHPNVVAVHDVGTHADQVWIAMEFVPGRTLGTWAKERPRRWPELLRVLTDVARGVAAAHAVGLVHRDLKPDNVMIGRDGRVRVMDFGLAHGRSFAAAEQGLAEGSTVEAFAQSDALLARTLPADPKVRPEFAALALRLTQVGSIQGTPAYMSPEQWRGEEASAAADQFGWSVMAWEMLFGERPFHGENMLALADNVLSGRRRPAGKRRGVPGWLRRLMERGLSSAARERWPTMAALVAELERGRTLARVRLAAAVAAGFALLGAGWAGYRQFDLAQRIDDCTAAGEQISGVWSEPVSEALRQQLIATGAPYAGSIHDRLKPRLDRWKERWDELRSDSCIAARVDGKLAEETYQKTVDCLEEHRDELSELLKVFTSNPGIDYSGRAVPALVQLSPPDDCVDPTYLERLPPIPADRTDRLRAADLRHRLLVAEVLDGLGNYGDSLELAQEVVSLATTLEFTAIELKARVLVGSVMTRLGQDDRAEVELVDAFNRAGAAGADDVAATAAVALIYAIGAREHRTSEGLLWGQVAEVFVRRSGQEESRLGAELYHNLAIVHFWADNADAARQNYERGLALWEKAMGADHPDVASALTSMSMFYEAQGDHATACAMGERSLAIIERSLGPDHPHAGLVLHNLGIWYREAGDHERSGDRFGRSLANLRAALGPDNAQVAAGLTDLAALRSLQGDMEAARALYEDGLAMFERNLPAGHPQLAEPLIGLGKVALLQGRPEDALAPLERAVALSAPNLVHDPDNAEGRFILARALWDASPGSGGDRARALGLAAEAASAFSVAPGVKRRMHEEVERWLRERGASSSSSDAKPASGGADNTASVR